MIETVEWLLLLLHQKKKNKKKNSKKLFSRLKSDIVRVKRFEFVENWMQEVVY